tara:strand:- start:17 stop:307 length:291 start_codon:yes stop_codon:yes gene_type:complete
MKKKIIVLGATGSIGQSTLDIIEKCNDKFQVVGVSANSNIKKNYLKFVKNLDQKMYFLLIRMSKIIYRNQNLMEMQNFFLVMIFTKNFLILILTLL